jgi:hypothetical protein
MLNSSLSLDLLSAAFDTIDQDVLLDRLERCVGLSGPVLNWFRTYLTGQEFFVTLVEHNSEKIDITCAFPQGSILSPVYILYITPWQRYQKAQR